MKNSRNASISDSDFTDGMSQQKDACQTHEIAPAHRLVTVNGVRPTGAYIRKPSHFLLHSVHAMDAPCLFISFLDVACTSVLLFKLFQYITGYCNLCATAHVSGQVGYQIPRVCSGYSVVLQVSSTHIRTGRTRTPKKQYNAKQHS